MTSLRDMIKGDFAAIADDQETVTIFDRLSTSPEAAAVRYVKRFSVHNEDEDLQSSGHLIKDFIMFDAPLVELSFDPRPGDYVVDAGNRRYVIFDKFQSRMTDVVKLKCIELSVVAPEKIDVYCRPHQRDPLGAPLPATVPYALDVSAKVVLFDQLAEDYFGDDARPTYRIGFFADARSIKLPLPQGAVFKTKDGRSYRMNSCFGYERLAGFMQANCVLEDAKKAS